jgi:hypothetical protein
VAVSLVSKKRGYLSKKPESTTREPGFAGEGGRPVASVDGLEPPCSPGFPLPGASRWYKRLRVALMVARYPDGTSRHG